MKELRLIEPVIELEGEFRKMLSDWDQSGEKVAPSVLGLNSDNFSEYINLITGFKTGIGIPETRVNHSTYWLINENYTILGAVSVRHELNEALKVEGGHIGYGIRPSGRRKGYATKILELSLIEAKKLQIEQVMVTCDKDNVASAKTILRNGGKLDEEYLHQGRIVQRYWIETPNWLKRPLGKHSGTS